MKCGKTKLRELIENGIRSNLQVYKMNPVECEILKTEREKMYSLNIQMDHIPMSLQISAWSDGNRRLKDRAPPTTMDTYAWLSKTLYRVLPGTAGFLDAVDARGANVAAVLLTACTTVPPGELRLYSLLFSSPLLASLTENNFEL